MLLDINYRNLHKSEALNTHVEDRLRTALTPFNGRITRVEVYLADENTPERHTPDDKRCLLEARPAGMDPIAVEEHADDIYAAVTGATHKLRRALDRRLRKVG